MKDEEREFGADLEESLGEQASGGIAPEVADLWADDPAATQPVPAHEAAAPASPAAGGQTRRRELSPPWVGGVAGAAFAAAAGVGVWFVARRPLPVAESGAAWAELVRPGLAIALTLALAGLAGWVVTGLLERWRQEKRRLRDVVRHVASLDPDSDHGWESAAVRVEPELARFLAFVHARDKRQRAELLRATIADGEAARLGASLMARERDCVAASFETPVVGRLAAGAALLFEELDQLRRERAALEERLETLGAQLAGAAAEARRWHGQAGRQVAALHGDLQRLAGEVRDLGARADGQARAARDREQGGAPSAADVLKALPASAGGGPAAMLVQTAHHLKDLVARGGSLAIQTALEVTRLGERGETLFPLTESLKSLVTEFQGIATRLEKLAREEEAASSALAGARSLLAALDESGYGKETESALWQGSAVGLDGLRVSLVRLGTDVSSVAQGFADQVDRLEALAGAVSELTGVPLEAVENAAVPVPAPFEVEAFVSTPEPTTGPAPAQQPAASAPADAAVRAAPPLFAKQDPPAASVETGVRFASPLFAAPEPEAPEAPEPEAAPAAAALPEEDDRVYDLSEFGAVALEEPEEAGEPDADRIYELSEFGAVALA